MAIYITFLQPDIVHINTAKREYKKVGHNGVLGVSTDCNGGAASFSKKYGSQKPYASQAASNSQP